MARVLILDCHEFFVEKFVARLQDAGHVGLGCTNVPDALTAIMHQPSFDHVLVYLGMPGVTGVEFHRRVERQLDGGPLTFINRGVVSDDESAYAEAEDLYFISAEVLLRDSITDILRRLASPRSLLDTSPRVCPLVQSQGDADASGAFPPVRS